jgi:hypothetical protein
MVLFRRTWSLPSEAPNPMKIPNDALSGSPTFTIEVVRREDGQYEATAPGTAVPPTVAQTEGDAAFLHSKALYDACMAGTVFPTTSKSDA